MILGLGTGIPMPSGVGATMDGPFSPLDLSPVLWLDASDTSTITEVGGAVSQWDDKSGNGNHVTQATAANQPTTGATTQNGLNVIDFNNDYLAASLAVNVGSVTVLIAAEETTSINYAGLVVLAPGSFNDYNSDNGLIATTSASPNRFEAYRKNLGSFIVDSKPSPFDVYVGRFSSNLLEAFTSSTTGSTTAVGGTPGLSTQVLIGARFINGAIHPTSRLVGNIAEIIVCDATLSNADLNAAGNYLAQKWGKTWTAK